MWSTRGAGSVVAADLGDLFTFTCAVDLGDTKTHMYVYEKGEKKIFFIGF